ncbi:MAG: hypothetical protein ACREQJ_16930, partial [Candidatus Binatia bacterium]
MEAGILAAKAKLSSGGLRGASSIFFSENPVYERKLGETMDFDLPEPTRLLQSLVRRFVTEELLPIEARALERECKGGPLTPPRDEMTVLWQKA